MNAKRLIVVALGSALLCSPVWLGAQESVADAARKAQAEKKTAPKPKFVIDNDNLDTLTGTINVVGQAPAPADQAKAAEAKAKPDAEKPPVKDEAYWRKQFAEANRKLTDDARELDILQREYNLKQQQYYTDPTVAMREQYTNQDLDDTRQKINDKTAAVAKDKQDISDLEDALRRAGGDPGWATPPSNSNSNSNPNQ